MKARIALILAPVLLIAGFALAQKPADTAPAKSAGTEARVIAIQKASYPLDTCPISKEKLGSMGEPVDMVVDGTLVRLCCSSCKKGVEKDKAAIVKSVQDAVVAQQSVGYPLDTCPMKGEKLEKPFNHVVGTRLVRFCCGDCAKAFTADAVKQTEAMAKLDGAWIAAQKPKYALTTCPVSGKPLGDTAVDHLYGTRLVRFCCKNCVKEMETKPEAVIAKLDAESKKGAPKAEDKKPEEKKPEEKKGGG